MYKLRFALYDTTEYMERFSDFLGRKHMLIESRLFTKKGYLEDFLERERVDVLLLGQEADGLSFRGQKNVGQVIVLSEGNILREHSELPVIFKYQSAETILQEILAILAESDGRLPVGHSQGKRGVEFVLCLSPYGSLSPMTASRLQDWDDVFQKKLLSVNLQLLDGSVRQEREPLKEGLGMSELLYYIQERKDKFSLKLQSVVCKRDELDVVHAVNNFRDLYRMTVEDMEFFLQMLEEETEYEVVVFEVGIITDWLLALMTKCSRIFLPEPKTEWEQGQLRHLEILLEEEGMSEVAAKIVFLECRGEAS